VQIKTAGGHDPTLHEVAEAARFIADAVDPDANIISGMVIDPSMEDAMKVTVIATGFDSGTGERRVVSHVSNLNRPLTLPVPMAAAPPAPVLEKEEPERPQVEVPFYRKVLAHARGEDPNGFGPNWSNVDDYDIPTVLRKQMD
jgi:cell division protein FtsZ